MFLGYVDNFTPQAIPCCQVTCSRRNSLMNLEFVRDKLNLALCSHTTLWLIFTSLKFVREGLKKVSVDPSM